jgi:PAS domain-containing protein
MNPKELNIHITSVLEFIEDLTIITNYDLEIVFANQNFLDRTKYLKKEIIGENLDKLISKKKVEFIKKSISKKSPISILKTKIETQTKKFFLVDIKGISIENNNNKYLCLFIKDDYFIAGTKNKEGYSALLKSLPDLLFSS